MTRRHLAAHPAPGRGAEIRAFSLVEILVVLGVIAILCAVIALGYGEYLNRARRVQCSNNLKNLHVAFASYLNDNQRWPQCPFMLGDAGYDEWWLAQMAPYKLQQPNWQCPSVKAEDLGATTPEEAKKFRIHYIPTPFDDKPGTPHLWATQPWFIEIGAAHGDGNLFIYPDGSVHSLNELLPKQ